MVEKDPPNNLYFAVILLFIGGALLIFNFYTSKLSKQGEIPTNVAGQGDVRTDSLPESASDKADDTKKVPTKFKLTTKGQRKKLFTTEKRLRELSKIAKRRFKKTARVSLSWPQDLSYTEVDGEDGVKTIHGYNPQTGVSLDALARPRPTDLSEIKKYVTQNDLYIPGLNGQKVRGLHKVNGLEEIPKKPGIGSIELLQGSTKSGDKVVFALINREDKKGSYLFVYTGPQKQFDQNDGYFEKLYQDLKVLPINTK